MALINCPECGKEISDKAKNCPNCGYPISDCINNESKNNHKDNEMKICPKCLMLRLASDPIDKCIYCNTELSGLGVTYDEMREKHPSFKRTFVKDVECKWRQGSIYDEALEKKRKTHKEIIKIVNLRKEGNLRKINETKNANIPKCPTCNSTNIIKISLTKKATGGAMFGLFSSNIAKTFECKNCGYKW